MEHDPIDALKRASDEFYDINEPALGSVAAAGAAFCAVAPRLARVIPTAAYARDMFDSIFRDTSRSSRDVERLFAVAQMMIGQWTRYHGGRDVCDCAECGVAEALIDLCEAVHVRTEHHWMRFAFDLSCASARLQEYYAVIDAGGNRAGALAHKAAQIELAYGLGELVVFERQITSPHA